MRRRLLLFGVVCLLPALVPAAASAELVRLTNGRTLRVEGYRLDNDRAVLLMAGGGEIRMARTLIAEILADPVSLPGEGGAAGRPAAGTRPTFAPREIRALVTRMAAEIGLDVRLAHAVVRAESNYDPFAVSPRGAMGLMQVMPVIARQYDVRDPFDPVQNLDAGLRHLRRLTRRLDLRRALAAYNAGESAVARHGGVPPYAETQTYVRRVLSYLQ